MNRIYDRITGVVAPVAPPRPPKSVATITAPLSSIVEDLKAHAEEQYALAMADEAAAMDLQARSASRKAESAKASDAADKIGALIA
jgi:hypothetical protein